jgi:hypothetical protein
LGNKPIKEENTIKPPREVRLGRIPAALWKNETEAGWRYLATCQRRHREGDHWASTEGFGRDDLLLLAKVVDQTHSWIYAQNQEGRGAANPALPSNAGATAQ